MGSLYVHNLPQLGQKHLHEFTRAYRTKNEPGSTHIEFSMDLTDPFSQMDISKNVVTALNSTAGGKMTKYDVNHDTMFQSPNSQCFIKPISSEEIGVGSMWVMFIFISAVVVGAIPQYLKLCVLGSADGLSLQSLALLNISCVAASLNVFILHFDQIKFCVKQKTNEYTMERCEASMLTLYYTLVYTLLWFPLYPLAASYCSDRKKMFMGRLMSEKHIAWTGWFAHGIPCLALCAPVIRMVVWYGCLEFENYAVALGLLNAVLEATRYLPQVLESWKYQGSGSMSYVRLVLSIAGGAGACVQKAKMHESPSTWAPPLVGHTLELVILFINLYYDAVNKKKKQNGETVEDRAKKFRSESESLLVDDTETENSDNDDTDDTESRSSFSATTKTASRANDVENKPTKKPAARFFSSSKAKKKADVEEAERLVKEEQKFLEGKHENWVEDMPEDQREHFGYFCHNLRNNPKFWKGLVKYM